MWLTTFGVHYNPPLNTVKITVFEIIMFHENTELLHYVDCYELSPGNNDPTEYIMIIIDGIPISKKHVWVDVA